MFSSRSHDNFTNITITSVENMIKTVLYDIIKEVKQVSDDGIQIFIEKNLNLPKTAVVSGTPPETTVKARGSKYLGKIVAMTSAV